MSLEQIVRPKPAWIPPEEIPDDVDLLGLYPHRLIASLLWRRGFRTPESAGEFMTTDGPETLDPARLPNLDRAIERTCRALRTGEHIGIFGDYDADGITSTAALCRALGSVIGVEHVTPFVPNRADGYGVSPRGVRYLAESGCTLMIAVDTGSNDHEAVALAQSLGMDVVILDHHHISGDEPEGSMLVNPHLRPDGPYTELTGAGVTYLFVMALAKAGFPVFRIDDNDSSRILDLITLGTVTDVGSLHGANRRIVRAGLEILRQSKRPGIQAMIRHGEFDPARLTSSRISFGLGPRLNASGRIGDPTMALRLLLTDDPEEANDLAMRLEQANRTRRLRSDDILNDVTERVLRLPNWQTLPFIALYGQSWDTGLVGPIANKIVERMGVPAIVMQERDGMLSGSGRSVKGVNLLELLQEAAPLMTRYGGHAGAGGVTLPVENFEAWNTAILNAIARKGHTLPQPPEIALHAWLPQQAWRLDVARVLQQLQPFGHGNAEPVFGIEKARLIRYTVLGREKTHLKLIVGTQGREMEALLWGGAARSNELVTATHVDLAGTLGINEWQGVERLQLILKDFRPAT